MTFLDKWKEEHPDSGSGWPSGCPSAFGYETYCFNDEYCYCRNNTCVDCWNREIPEKTWIDEYVEEKAEKIDKKTIYAHMGFSEEQAEAIEEMNEGKKTPNDVREMFGLPRILDSGARREFGTGAVRDIQEGKGRCDLLPLDVVATIIRDELVDQIYSFQQTGDVSYLYTALEMFEWHWGRNVECAEDLILASVSTNYKQSTMCLEVSIHFEEGAKKYGENNWQRGIPVHCYIDSAVRHYLKFLRGDKDEPHDRAFCWNIMCAIWTCKHKPELNDYAKRDTSEVEAVMG